MPFYSIPHGNSPVLAGDGPPEPELGSVGDIYIDRAGSLLYGPKLETGWGPGTVIGFGGGGGATSLAELTDTDIASLAEGDVLRFESGKWRNHPDLNLTDGGNF